MLPDLHNLNLANLVDLLAQETQRFTQLMGEKQFSAEYEACKEAIQKIQEAIELKKGPTSSTPDINYTKSDYSQKQ
jgi:hypothetical protein